MNFKTLQLAKEYLGIPELVNQTRLVQVAGNLLYLTSVKVGTNYYWLTQEERDEISTAHW